MGYSPAVDFGLVVGVCVRFFTSSSFSFFAFEASLESNYCVQSPNKSEFIEATDNNKRCFFVLESESI